MQPRDADAYQAWLVGELLLVGLLGAAMALFLTNPCAPDAYELPEGRLVLDTAVVLAATIVADPRRRPLLGRGPAARPAARAPGFCVAGVGTLAFSVVPVSAASRRAPAEAWAALGARVLAARPDRARPVRRRAPNGRAAARARRRDRRRCCSPLFVIWLVLRGSAAR